MSQKASRRAFWTFAAASFLNDFGSDVIYPIWPLFVTVFLGADKTVLGFIDGLGDAVVSLSQAGSGYVSDKARKRKVFVWTGYLFGAASRIGYAFSTLWQHLIPFRILDRAGKMRGAPRDAIVADLSTRENRGKNFGVLRTMDNLGAVCGIIVCIIFFGMLGYMRLFLLAAIPSVIGALLILLLIREPKQSDVRLYKGLSLRNMNRNFKMFLSLSALFALGSFSYSFLLLYAKQFGFQDNFVPILYLVFTAMASIFSFPFGRLSDKVGRKTVLTMSYVLWGLVCLSFAFAEGYIMTVLTFVLYGMHKGALEPVQKSFVSELAPKDFRASGLGVFQLVTGLCALPSSFIAGLLWDQFGPSVPFFLSLVLTAVSIAMLPFVRENKSD